MNNDAEKLKELRAERGLSLGYVSRRFGRSKQWIYRLERGDRIELTEEYKEKYAQILNVHKDRLWSVAEDKELVVRPSQLRDLSSPLTGVTKGRAIRKMLTLRNKAPEIPGQTGYLLIPYLLEYQPGTNTLPHSHIPSLETGVVIQGHIRLSLESVEADGAASRFDKKDLSEGDSYTISSNMPHFTQNIGSETSLTLVVRLPIIPWEVTTHSNRYWITIPENLPKRELVAITNRRSIRMVEGVLDWTPGAPGVPYHRHEWSEEFIYVVSGGLKVKISPTGDESTPPVVHELEAGSSIHMDGRLLHSLENLSDYEKVRYIVVHKLDFNDFGGY